MSAQSDKPQEAIHKLPALDIEIEQLKGKTSVILGAGFPRDYNNETIPLANDFLWVAERNGVFDRTGRHKELDEFVRKYFWDYRSVNIETLATFLTTKLLPEVGERDEQRTKLYADLIDIIVATLEEAHEHPSNSNVLEKYKKFANFLLAIEANVITFNYDLVLDQLLLSSQKWSTADGYGVKMRFYRDDIIEEAERQRIRSSLVRYYKLHGSLNWGKLKIPDPYVGNSVYLHPCSLPVSHPDGSIRSIESVRRAAQKADGSRSVDVLMEPFIVPPILSKEEFQKEPMLMNIWYLARDVIWKSKYVFIIGYSFPPTDFLFEFVLRQVIANPVQVFQQVKRDMRRIHIVQPKESKEYQDRIEDIFGTGFFSTYYMRTLRFIDTLFASLRSNEFR